jgi:hypothetical protein
METKNAFIRNARLGISDYGIVMASLVLDYGDSTQVFGPFALCTPRRIDGPAGSKDYTGWFVGYMLEAVGVYEWSDLAGIAVRVLADDEDVYAIGHIIKDRWFPPKEALELLKRESSAQSGINNEGKE